MTWEEVIIRARKNPAYFEVLHQSFLNEDIIDNVNRFRLSEEFAETTSLINEYTGGKNSKILDIGCGNGISAVSFALKGYEVTAVEPDPSETVGRGAIEKLAKYFNVKMQISDGVGEKLPVPDQSFDLVYLRQTLHHATNIETFLKECYRVLKSGGVLLTIRDHVIYGKKDKEIFLSSHPFHKYYGGENAYKKNEYLNAFRNAGFHILKIMQHYDSVINYYPLSKEEFYNYPLKLKEALQKSLNKRYGYSGNLFFLQWVFRCYKGLYPSWYNEKLVPGRMYSFIATKK